MRGSATDYKPLCMIVDHHPLVRQGLRRLLERDYEVEELSDGAGAVELMTSVGGFEVAVVEMRSAPQAGAPSGAETIRSLLGAQPALGVVARGGPLTRHIAREAFDAGANAWIGSRSDSGALLEAVHAAAAQEHYLDPAIRGMEGTAVTRRQRQVLQLFADGLSTDQVAHRLGLSEETVRTHAKASLARLGARDRTHAVAIALRGGLID